MATFRVRFMDASGDELFQEVEAAGPGIAASAVSRKGRTILKVEPVAGPVAVVGAEAPRDPDAAQMAQQLAAMQKQLAEINRKTPKRFSWVRVLALFIVVVIILAVLA